ncbi:MAG TPA: HAMP domain-containing sensor histidine kinase, partial [Thermoanaerobaculia bacterium]
MGTRGLARRLPIAIAALLLVLLAVLAVLQWRWIGEVSDMEQQRMRAGLARSAGHFAEDFDREVARLFLFFHPEMDAPDGDPRQRVVRQYERWQAEAPYPELVRDVFLIYGGETGEPVLEVLRPRARRFEPFPWPAELAALRKEASGPSGLHTGFRGMAPVMRAEVPGLLVPLSFRQPETGEAGGRPDGGHLLVRLDLRAVSGQILPALTRRHFDDARGGEYALAVTDPADGRVIFLSDPQVPASAFAAADLRLGMLQLRPFDELHSLVPRHGGGRSHWRRMMELPHLRLGGPPPAEPWERRGAWTLALKHRDGSLEAAVAHIRYHNLGVSLGILALLAGSVAMLLVSTQRAQRLARQQIEFVAGVTHELNTPLTAIRSAGQNLADGVVAEPAQVRRYGNLIADEGRRLSDMVGQALEFAGIQSGRRTYHPRPVEVNEIVDGALQDSRWLLQERRIEVEREVEPGLPAVLADAAALRRAVQNLVENAVKHGGEGGWIGVRARRAGAGQVEITVADRGPGIAAEDLPHLFEPFFRGRRAGNVPGSGLGLSLVRHIAEAHGGRVSVDSAPGRGSAFTLRLPAASEETAMQ